MTYNKLAGSPSSTTNDEEMEFLDESKIEDEDNDYLA